MPDLGMDRERHVTELIPAYALDALDLEEKRIVEEHLAGCAICRDELSAYQGVVEHLALAAPDAVPSPALKGRLLERVRPKAEPRPSWWEQLAALWRQAAPAWGVISVVIIIGLVLLNLNLRDQSQAGTVDPSGMRVVALSGTDAAPEAVGKLVLSRDGEYGALIVDGLPPLSEAQQYQLWLIKDGQRTSGGLLSVNDEGYGALWISASESLDIYAEFGMTVEPAGGSPGPTGEKVLGGSL
jgi:anti-sigma-K factor RskA